MFSLLFKRFNNLPVIVVKGGECEPFMISPMKTMARPPGSGEFTCCVRSHKMTNPDDGSEREIACDKVKIGELTWTMLQSKLSFLLGDGQIKEYRLWLALVPHFMQGMPSEKTALKRSRSSVSPEEHKATSTKNFLAAYHFQTVKDEEGRSGSGMTPLMHAVMVGNVEVVEELLAQGANVKNALREFETTLGCDIGFTALHFAVAVCPTRVVEMVTVLLRAGADANEPSKSGSTPLMAGVALHNMLGVVALIECAGNTLLKLEQGVKINHNTALGVAAYLGQWVFVARRGYAWGCTPLGSVTRCSASGKNALRRGCVVR